MTDIARYLDMPTRITADGHVYFGDEELPGCIAENGVTVTPGFTRDINRMTVTFLVGQVVVEDRE